MSQDVKMKENDLITSSNILLLIRLAHRTRSTLFTANVLYELLTH